MTGQSFAFSETYAGITCNEKWIVGHSLSNQSMAVKIASYLLVLFKIIYHLIVYPVDIVYFTGSRTLLGGFKDIVTIYTAKALRIKVVNHLHGTALNSFFSSIPRLLRPLYLNAYRRTDVNIVLMPEMANELRGMLGTNNIQTIANFYDKDLDGMHDKNNLNEELKIVYLSNIIKSKGIIELLDAINICVERKYPVRLSVAGVFFGDDLSTQESIREEFESKISRTENVSYLGAVSGVTKLNLLLESDVFILPTYYKIEAFPLSILEAMRTGNYIVTTDHNFLKTIVGDENGRLIQKQSVDEIVSAIEEVLNDRVRLRNVQQFNMKFVQKKYSYDRYIEKLHELFHSLLK